MDGQTRRIYIDMLITEIYESQFSSIGMIVFVPRSLLFVFESMPFPCNAKSYMMHKL